MVYRSLYAGLLEREKYKITHTKAALQNVGLFFGCIYDKINRALVGCFEGWSEE